LLSGTSAFAMEKQKADSTWNDWSFRISPYFWYIGFKGTIYRPPYNGNYPEPEPKYEIDVKFKDIRNSIKFALMLAGQYKGEHIVAQFNLSSLIMESEAITSWEILFQDNIVNLTFFSGDLEVGYRVIKSDKFELDALVGLKFIYFKIGLSTKLAGIVEVEGERNHLWFDPGFGMNIRYRPFHRIEIIAYGDLGTALLNTDLSYQVIGGVNYLFTKTFHVSLGYRMYYIKAPKEDAIYNGQVKGWIMKIGFQF